MRKSFSTQHSRSALVHKVQFCKTFWTTLLNWTVLRKEIFGLSWIWIPNSIAGLVSRAFGTAANVIESISCMVVGEMVHVISHETEPTSVQDTISGPESNKWIDTIPSDISFGQGNRTWEPCCLPPGRKAIPIMWVFKNKTKDERKLCP